MTGTQTGVIQKPGVRADAQAMETFSSPVSHRDLLIMLSYRTQDHAYRVALPTREWVLAHKH